MSRLKASDLPGIGPTVPRGLTIFDMLLPPQAVLLILLLLLVTPLVLLTGESLFVPFIEWTKANLSMGSETTYTALPLHFFIKVGAFLVLSFLGGLQLLFRLNTIYYSVWSKAFPRPNALHVDYQPDKNQSMLSLMGWTAYRTANILLPPVLMGLITFVVGLLEFYLFNMLSELSLISLPFQFTVELFIIMLLGMFTVIALLNSLWNTLTTLFGDVAAVTEPDLPYKLIYDRCGRLAFSSPYVYFLIPSYLLFGVVILAEVVLLLLMVDIQDVITFQANLPMIALLEILTFGLYLLIQYFTFFTYHHSLALYYHKLPAQLKECFTPPTSAQAVTG